MGQSACYTGVSSYVFDSSDAHQVIQEQHRVSAFNLPPGTGDTDLLDLVEAEINPVFVLPEGQGVRAADGVVVLQ